MKTKSQRIVLPPPRHASKRGLCKIEGCREDTCEGKPYCTKHVLQHPFVKDLLQRMADRVAEDERVRKGGSKVVDVDNPGITLKEILRVLKVEKTRTEERLSRDLQIPCSVIHNYCVALKARGIVKIKTKGYGRQEVTYVGNS